jgi:hypothetical protein
MKPTYKDFKNQHEEMKRIIVALRSEGANKNLIHSLAHVNQFLYNEMCKCLIEKDENGNYKTIECRPEDTLRIDGDDPQLINGIHNPNGT